MAEDTSRLTVLQAVQCQQCRTLHSVEGSSYLLIQGEIVRRRGSNGRLPLESTHLDALFVGQPVCGWKCIDLGL